MFFSRTVPSARRQATQSSGPKLCGQELAAAHPNISGPSASRPPRSLQASGEVLYCAFNSRVSLSSSPFSFPVLRSMDDLHNCILDGHKNPEELQI